MKYGRRGELFPGKFPALRSAVWPPDRSQALQVQTYNPPSFPSLPPSLPPSILMQGKTQRRAAGAECQMCQVIPADRLRIKEHGVQEREVYVCVRVCERYVGAGGRLEERHTSVQSSYVLIRMFFFFVGCAATKETFQLLPNCN